MGIVLALQFYFFDKAQHDMYTEFNRLTRTLNNTTESYYHNVLKTIEEDEIKKQRDEKNLADLLKNYSNKEYWNKLEDYSLLEKGKFADSVDFVIQKSTVDRNEKDVAVEQYFLKSEHFPPDYDWQGEVKVKDGHMDIDVFTDFSILLLPGHNWNSLPNK